MLLAQKSQTYLFAEVRTTCSWPVYCLVGLSPHMMRCWPVYCRLIGLSLHTKCDTFFTCLLQSDWPQYIYDVLLTCLLHSDWAQSIYDVLLTCFYCSLIGLSTYMMCYWPVFIAVWLGLVHIIIAVTQMVLNNLGVSQIRNPVILTSVMSVLSVSCPLIKHIFAAISTHLRNYSVIKS